MSAVPSASREDATVRSVVHTVNTTFPASSDQPEVPPCVHSGLSRSSVCISHYPSATVYGIADVSHNAHEGGPTDGARAVGSTGALFKTPASVSTTALSPTGERLRHPAQCRIELTICNMYTVYLRTLCAPVCSRSYVRRSLRCTMFRLMYWQLPQHAMDYRPLGGGISGCHNRKPFHSYSSCHGNYIVYVTLVYLHISSSLAVIE